MVKVDIQLKRGRGNRIASKSRIQQYVHAELTKLWRHSVQAFVKEASQHVGIDTGMSLASMIPLAREVRLGSLLEASIHGKGIRRGAYTLDGTYHPGLNQSKAAGRRAGAEAYTLTFGTPQRNDLRFEFHIVVYQYYLHELGYAKNDPRAWDSLGKGKAAFLAFFNANYTKYVRAGTIYNLLEGN